MKKGGFLLMLLILALFSSCKDEDVFTPEAMKPLVSATKSYKVNGSDLKMIYVPEVLLQERIDGQLDALKVVVQPSYYIMQTEVTQSLFSSVMDYTAAWGEYLGENLPANYLNLNQCRDFAAKLNQVLQTPNYFRLPSSKEWMYAAQDAQKAGTTIYAGSDNIDDVAWYNTNSDGHIHTVGLKAPNKLGLYDMSGNVSEWTDDTRYNSDGSINGEISGNLYGGNFEVASNVCVVSSTLASQPASNTHYTYGFRLAATASSGEYVNVAETVGENQDFVWNVVPNVVGNVCTFNVNNAQTGNKKCTISIELTPSAAVQSWEFFPSSYYILKVNSDLVSCTVTDAETSKTTDIISGFVSVRKGVVILNLTVVSPKDADKLETISGSRAITLNEFNLSQIDKIHPLLDQSDATGKTAIFDSYIGNEFFSRTRVVLKSDNAEWDFYKAATYTIGTDATVTSNIISTGKDAEFTVGTITLDGVGGISISATGLYNNGTYSLVTSRPKLVSAVQHTLVGATISAENANGSKTAIFTIIDATQTKVLSVTLNDATSWDLAPADGQYKNYEVGNTISKATVTVSSIEGKVQYGKLNINVDSDGNSILTSSLIGWVDNILVSITGSEKMTVR